MTFQNLFLKLPYVILITLHPCRSHSKTASFSVKYKSKLSNNSNIFPMTTVFGAQDLWKSRNTQNTAQVYCIIIKNYAYICGFVTDRIMCCNRIWAELKLKKDYWKYGQNSHLRCSNNLASPKEGHLLPPCSTTTSTYSPHITFSSLTLPLCGSSSGANLIHKFSIRIPILLLHNVLLFQHVGSLQQGIRRPPLLVQGGKGADGSTSVVLYNLKK